MVKRIKVPKDSEGIEVSGNWNFCVGTGRLGLALQKEYLGFMPPKLAPGENTIFLLEGEYYTTKGL